MNLKSIFLMLTLALAFSFSACKQNSETSKPKMSENKLLMAVLYNYYAAEYQALCYQAYNIGKERLAEIRKNNPESRNLAVVVDIDETVLDNSPSEAKLILDNKSYADEDWNKWCAMATAEAVPGSVEFLKFADSLGFTIFYVSNRKDQFTREGTIQNLLNQGFPQVIEEQVLLRTGEREKDGRRLAISENYSIVMLVGDNIGDFYEDTFEFANREETMLSNKYNFGKKYIVIPNSMYGDWMKAIHLSGNENTVDSLLKLMVQRHYSN
jgi:5'-nucleotidase (lipoprotein e(P4) family)